MKSQFAFAVAEVFQRYYIAIKTICVLTLTVLASVPLAHLWPIAARVDTASRQLLECNHNAACLQSQLLAITGSTRATMSEVAKAAPAITMALRAASENSVAASRATVTTAEDASALLAAATALVTETQATVLDLRSSVHALAVDSDTLILSSNATVAQTGAVLTHLSTLEVELETQIHTQSPEIGHTLQSMQALLADPALQDTIKHLDATAISGEESAKNLSEITKTFDIATRDLRKKVGRVKWVIDKLFNLIRFQYKF